MCASFLLLVCRLFGAGALEDIVVLVVLVFEAFAFAGGDRGAITPVEEKGRRLKNENDDD